MDLNYIDPADNRTILDFISSEIEQLKKSPIDYKEKITEFKRLYDLLQKNGAKHANEL